jgi:hypothetical protein
MASTVEIAWSERTDQADWLKERLEGKAGSTVASVVPGGFEAYARVLHPAQVEGDGEASSARWAEVASLSDLPLLPDARFHSVALPPDDAGDADLTKYRPPRRGSLTAEDATVLASVLRGATPDAGDCWFCLWEGYAWQGRASDPIPPEILDGAKVSVSGREFVLYKGPVEACCAVEGPVCQTANIWWPADTSWCVVSDIDLPWTYVGGTAAVVEQLCGRSDIEVLPAAAGDPVRKVEDRVLRWAASGADQLLRTGNARVETPRGVLEAWFERPGLQPGALGINCQTDDGRRWGKRTRIEHRVDQELRHLLSLHFSMHIVDLVEG